VIVVLGILLSLLLPAFNSIREGARQSVCSNQLRQLGLGLQQYESRKGAFPAAATGARSGEFKDEPRYNVLAYILPYLELDYISDIFDMELNWNDETRRNDELSAEQLAIFMARMGAKSSRYKVTNERIAGQDAFQFLCSSAPVRDNDVSQGTRTYRYPHAATDYCSAYSIDDGLYSRYTNIHGYDGPKAAFEKGGLQLNKELRTSAYRDGLGNTFMLFESAGKPYRYLDGKPYGSAYDSYTQWSNWEASMKLNPGIQGQTFNRDKLINHTNIGEVYSFHPDGAMILYGDGAVKFESEEMPIDVFVNRFTRDGGEVEYRD
ncbi:MAG: DUF1559 domain-containing protein, partial [Planctomycetota bacterium]|nr:DUF1559 domain-containing protein [Planctomycetota bacterium]